jgi:hypothetical protein
MEEAILPFLLKQTLPVIILGFNVYYFLKQVEKVEKKFEEKEKQWHTDNLTLLTERAGERVQLIQTLESVKHVIEENTKVMQKLDETSRTKKVREAV